MVWTLPAPSRKRVAGDELRAAAGVLVQDEVAARNGDELGVASFGLGGEDVGEERALSGGDGGGAGQVG